MLKRAVDGQLDLRTLPLLQPPAILLSTKGRTYGHLSSAEDWNSTIDTKHLIVLVS